MRLGLFSHSSIQDRGTCLLDRARRRRSVLGKEHNASCCRQFAKKPEMFWLRSILLVKICKRPSKKPRRISFQRCTERIQDDADMKEDEEALCEEQRIIDDAVTEDVGPKGKALSEETVQQEMAKEASEVSSPSIRVLAMNAALEAEAKRLRMYNEKEEEIPNIPKQVYKNIDRHMFKMLKNITVTHEGIMTRAQELISAINDPMCPRSISILIFARKVVALCANRRGDSDKPVFACARIVLLVASQVPDVTDILLAEFHKACIYTVPKYLHPPSPDAKTKDYWEMIGYREEDNKLESSASYLKHMRAHMELYAALIQTEIEGIRNPHGLEQGWAWLAMFLNALPANRMTATALDGFLRMAGHALFAQYGSQFVKLMNVISGSYLPALKGGQDVVEIVQRLEQYLNGESYRLKPEGCSLEEGCLLSEKAFEGEGNL